MGWLGLAGAEVFEVVEGGGEVGRCAGEGGLHGGVEGFGIALGAQVDDELAAFDGGIEVCR